MKIKTILKVIVFLVIVSGVGFFSYQAGILVGEENILKTPPPSVINQDLEAPEKINFSVFWETWRKVEQNFLEKEKIDYQKMVYGAITGMVKTLDDPYTTFFTPQQAKNFEEELSGKYEGVGMVVGIKDNQLTVISPFKGTPADNAGLKAGDKILKVGDTLTQELSIEEAVALIKGPRSTEVKLLIQRKDWQEPKEFVLKRDVITIPTLEWEILEGDIASIKIYQFNQILPSEFEKAALEILREGTKKLIVDLRNNPGGYLEVAQEIAGWFLKKGDVVTWQDMGKDKERKPYKAEGPSAFSQYPTVVLINEGSASASEILAGALRDQRGSKLIGEKSFGKGSVQEQIDLSDSSSLKITVAKWLTPNGHSIDKQGLEPDIKVSSSTSTEESGVTQEDEEDIPLKKAIEILTSGD